MYTIWCMYYADFWDKPMTCWASIVIGCRAWSSFGCQWRLDFCSDWVPSIVGLWLWLGANENWTLRANDDWTFGGNCVESANENWALWILMRNGLFFFFTFFFRWEWKLRFYVPMKIGLWFGKEVGSANENWALWIPMRIRL